jgi:uncharacterized phiE125 gp8 family phage protein
MIPKSILETLALDGTTALTISPILSFADIQTFLRIDGTTDQPLVQSLISGVTKRIESFIDRKIVTQVWSVYYDWFPFKDKLDNWWDGERQGSVKELYADVNYIDLPFGPCQSLDFVKSFDQTDVGTVFDAASYSLDTISPVPRIALKIGYIWPTTILRPVNGVQVRGTFGFGAPTNVPQDIIEAMKITVAYMYENRGDADVTLTAKTTPVSIPTTAQMLLEPYRRFKLGGR